MKQTQEFPIWFDGKYINEILLYEFLLQQQEIKCINGILYNMDGEVSDAEKDIKIKSTDVKSNAYVPICEKVALTVEATEYSNIGQNRIINL